VQRRNLLDVANKTDLPLVFLTSGFTSRIPDDTATYGEALSPAGLAEVRSASAAGNPPCGWPWGHA
jgi:hypothetical protein